MLGWWSFGRAYGYLQRINLPSCRNCSVHGKVDGPDSVVVEVNYMSGCINTLEGPIPQALNFCEYFQSDLTVLFELRGWIYFPHQSFLSVSLPLSLTASCTAICSRHLVVRLDVYIIYLPVTYLRMCTWTVWVALMFNGDDLCWIICGITNLLVIRKLYVNLSRVGGDDVKRATRVNVHDSFGRHERMIFGRVLTENYLQ